MRPRIFIGYDSRMPIASDVLKYSLEKHISTPLTITMLNVAQLEREIGFRRPLDPLQSTEFTYTRFLVPYLCGYKGSAIFMDNDMVCLADINEVFDLSLDSYWLRVVKHDQHPTNTIKMDGKVQTSYPRKNWSSFMLLNCEKLTMWTKEAVETQPAKWLHRFEPVPDERIGDIPKMWNVLDYRDENTKLIHYTEGGPWFERCKDHPYGGVWFKYKEEYEMARAGKAAAKV
ncbi:MAG: glycosyltransferase [Candidatus Omnitrophota bacterium]